MQGCVPSQCSDGGQLVCTLPGHKLPELHVVLLSASQEVLCGAHCVRACPGTDRTHTHFCLENLEYVNSSSC